MFVWVVLLALVHTFVYFLTYYIWGKIDKNIGKSEVDDIVDILKKGDEKCSEGDVGCVDCDKKPIPFWAVILIQIAIDIGFGLLAIIGFALVILLRKHIKWFHFGNPDVSWKSHRQYFINPILKYIGYIVCLRFILESLKSFVNFETNLMETLPLETATALRKCTKQKDTDEKIPETIESKDCSSNIPEDEFSVPGVSSLHPILARHSIRQSLVHGIFMVYAGIGVAISWRLNEWLSTNSNDGANYEDAKNPESKTIDDNEDSGYDTKSKLDDGETVSEKDVEIRAQGEDDTTILKQTENNEEAETTETKETTETTGTKETKETEANGSNEEKKTKIGPLTGTETNSSQSNKNENNNSIKNFVSFFDVPKSDVINNTETAILSLFPEKTKEEKDEIIDFFKIDENNKESEEEFELSSQEEGENVIVKTKIPIPCTLKYNVIVVLHSILSILKNLKNDGMGSYISNTISKFKPIIYEFISDENLIRDVNTVEIFNKFICLTNGSYEESKLCKLEIGDIQKAFDTIFIEKDTDIVEDETSTDVQNGIKIKPNADINYDKLFEVANKILLEFEISQLVPIEILSDKIKIPWVLKAIISNLVLSKIKFKSGKNNEYINLFRSLKSKKEYTYEYIESFVYELYNLVKTSDILDVDNNIKLPEYLTAKLDDPKEKPGKIKYIFLLIVNLIFGVVSSFAKKIPVNLITSFVKINKGQTISIGHASMKPIEPFLVLALGIHNLGISDFVNIIFDIVLDKEDDSKIVDVHEKENSVKYIHDNLKRLVSTATNKIVSSLIISSDSINIGDNIVKTQGDIINTILNVIENIDIDFIYKIVAVIVVELDVIEISKQFLKHNGFEEHITKIIKDIVNEIVLSETHTLKKYENLFREFVSNNKIDLNAIEEFVFQFYKLTIDSQIEKDTSGDGIEIPEIFFKFRTKCDGLSTQDGIDMEMT